MKKIITLCFLTSICFYSHAQTFFATINGYNYSDTRNIINTEEGGVLLIGYAADDYTQASRDIYVVKADKRGAVTWSTTLGFPNNYEEGLAGIQTTDKGFLITGVAFLTDTTGHYTYNCVLIKLDSLGNKEWSKQYLRPGSEADSHPNSIILTPDKGFLVGMADYGNMGGFAGLLKVDAHGVVEKFILLSEPAFVTLSKIITADNGDLLIFMQQSDPDQFVLIRVKSNGELVWAKSFGSYGSDRAVDIIETKDKGFAVLGTVHAYLVGSPSPIEVIKLDSTGNVLWIKGVSGSSYVSASSIAETPDESLIACGYTTSFDAADAYFIKFSKTGELMWTKTAGGSNADYARSIIRTRDNGYIVGGRTSSYGVAAQMDLLKFDSSFSICVATNSDGIVQDAHFTQKEIPVSFLPLSIDTAQGPDVISRNNATIQFICRSSSVATPKNFSKTTSLLQNISVFPNPADAYINVRFSSKKNENGIVEIYNLSGSKLFQSSIRINEGNNEKLIKLSGLPKGFYRLKVIKNDNTLNSQFYKN